MMGAWLVVYTIDWSGNLITLANVWRHIIICFIIYLRSLRCVLPLGKLCDCMGSCRKSDATVSKQLTTPYIMTEARINELLV
ncbi:hypothetical protein K449DRAFT_109288 [Hypoxylon sp. EC38]|nr:hypothetical protein K449DRAFT_109288 [Hypoxylon sp. EC38]